ncbi:putative baseplate assembly protein [Chitinimonas arctica]|uniref:Putative baseplate assembly protein n=1 Tax=Chitinimonas arctica TaxID=2594795 RepID=A0A516SLH1_9NEIS|nr:putative baseplate assembly protein [Chitinimonas arctica]QDQ28995.1 putative baseplate assembly protein [Chitinimonas arctica]
MSDCCERDARRQAVRQRQDLNGLDYLEVAGDQLSLQVYFLGKLPPQLSEKIVGEVPWLRIEGGRRVTGIRVVAVEPTIDPDPERDDFLTVFLDRYGDFSTYTLRLLGVERIDPRYDRLAFSFKIDCPTDLDCRQAPSCVEALPVEPDLNYLAKDYQSFRQLILDRWAVLMPQWREHHAADVGMALVELLAYVGDHLSYYQDAVGTEAYLDTARQRISVRRHARLVDYRLHEGCNARAWVAIESAVDFPLAAGTAFVTSLQDARANGKAIIDSELLASLPAADHELFEAMAPATIYASHSEIHFHGWGQRACCLEQGSTSATLLDAWPVDPAPNEPPALGGGERALRLKPGDVLVLEEVIGPGTGLAEDADPARRHAVRLIRVTPVQDEVLLDKHGRPTPCLDVEWSIADALPFSFCLSAIGPAPDCAYLEKVTVARGNIVLVDHGRTTPSQGQEGLGTVPAAGSSASCRCAGLPGEVRVAAGPYQPTLARGPLVFSQPLPDDDPVGGIWQAAASRLDQDVRQALPQIWLSSSRAGQGEQAWQPRYDLLASGPDDLHFVVEMDNAAIAHLRFGDGELGSAPVAGDGFQARYRVGGGTAGNVGAEAIRHLLLDGFSAGDGLRIRNPLPARGGKPAEPLAEAKLYAPRQFRKWIERAVTAADYQTLAERMGGIQRAAAKLAWTGSWYEAQLAIDPLGSEILAPLQREAIAAGLAPYRRIGHDLAVVQARYVPLYLKLHVCALPHMERAAVKAALLTVFGKKTLPGGKRGFFHPDQLSFGAGITVSSIVAAAQAVPGVQCASVTALRRQFEAANREIEQGILPLGNGEIAQLDNDPSFPEHGVLDIVVDGGR